MGCSQSTPAPAPPAPTPAQAPPDASPPPSAPSSEKAEKPPPAAAAPLPHVHNENSSVDLDDVKPVRFQPSPNAKRRLSVDTLDVKMVGMKYAVRGTVAIRAAQLKKQLKSGPPLPFDELILCNIGNPHAVKQKPITFYRQVAAALYMPEIATDPDALVKSGLFPTDVVARAKAYHECTGGNGVGAYTDSNGLQLVREEVCDFIEKRDGFPARPADVSLTTGASEGVKRSISAIVSGPTVGLMIPKPQYPLYSASLSMTGGRAIYYDLFEDKGWQTSLAELVRAYDAATADGTTVRSLAIINPGNPVGAVMSEEALAEVVAFCAVKELVLLADEVYQINIYAEGKAFHSCKKVLRKLQQKQLAYPAACVELAGGEAALAARLDAAQLISFHSTSKGLIGECGQRGGYMEYVGFSEATMAQFTKVAATSLSSNTVGQIFVGLMVKGPQPGDPSHERFVAESSAIMAGLRGRAAKATTELNKIEGVSSAPIEGAMYAFPSIRLPVKLVAQCKEEGADADEAWCVSLMEKTGIVCVPGSGFGQKPGTFHVRMTILPPEDMFNTMLQKLGAFQKTLYEEWGPPGELEAC